MIYGYARVSTDGQSVEAQVAALTAAGAGKIFREVASGAKTDRAQLRRLLDTLDAGDVLMVTRLDRLARSTRDLLNTLASIAGKQAGFRSLGDAWADTTTPHGRLMLTVLGGLAEFERELIRARTGEGRARGSYVFTRTRAARSRSNTGSRHDNSSASVARAALKLPRSALDFGSMAISTNKGFSSIITNCSPPSVPHDTPPALSRR
jgi:Resolvase, N terminal domain